MKLTHAERSELSRRSALAVWGDPVRRERRVKAFREAFAERRKRRRARADAQAERIVALYAEYPSDTIASFLRISAAEVIRVLRERGVPFRKRAPAKRPRAREHLRPAAEKGRAR